MFCPLVTGGGSGPVGCETATRCGVIEGVVIWATESVVIVVCIPTQLHTVVNAWRTVDNGTGSFSVWLMKGFNHGCSGISMEMSSPILSRVELISCSWL